MSSTDPTHEADAPEAGDLDVAIVGMAGRFPGADDLETFWSNLRSGVESISFFGDGELRAAGVPESEMAHPDYVPAAGRLRDVEHFDAGFFGYSPREAEVLEPGHRLFLECAWEALEDAGVDPAQVEGSVGVYAGAGSSGYAERHVKPNAAVLAATGEFQAALGSEKDFLATRASYKLDLRGPSVTVQTGCSTSLVAVHMAAQSLLRGECAVALAGGVSVIIPQTAGYTWQHGSIVSPDGHCRAFDANSAGAVSGSGAGVVVLKRLADALRDGDAVRAVIRGSAVNNDGAAKVAFTAPGVDGQAAVIAEALEAADVDPDTVTYIEAHGTGTDLGDVIEIAALTRAFRDFTDREGYCAIGSVKTNIGHLDTAAGIAGLIKTVLAMEHGQVPPTVHFRAPNPRIGFEGSPFFVAAGQTRPWDTDGGPRRAGVSSFGIGGTNAHVVLEEAPSAAAGPSRPWQLLAVSARSASAAQAASGRLADHLQNHPELDMADVAFTLREGRHAFAHRRIAILHQSEDAAAILRGAVPERIAAGVAEAGSRSVVFLFSGLGDHYPNMARGLYEAEPVFRAEVDRCAALLRPHLGLDIREVMFPGDAPSDEAPRASGFDLRRMLERAAPDPAFDRLNRTELAQPAVFVVDYALARLWMSWGIAPDAVIGHSLGEYAAACIAGIVSLEDALHLVAARAKLIEPLPGGAMLAVSADADAVRPYLGDGLAIATVNAPGMCVVAGPEDAAASLEARLADAGVTARRLPTTHAFHTPMLAPAAERLTEIARTVRLRPPRIPMVSNVTGTWITDAEATDPAYWTRHMLGTVRFADGVAELLREKGRVLLEVGPGQTLCTFVRQRPGDGEEAPVAVIPSTRFAYDRRPDQAVLLDALGRLWLAGVRPDWKAFRGAERRRRAHLPTYPWEKQRYWVDAPDASALPATAPRSSADPADWTYVPDWRRSPASSPSAEVQRVVLISTDDFGDALAASIDRTGRQATVRHIPTSADRDDFRSLVDSLLEPIDVVACVTNDPVALLMLAEALAHASVGARIVAITRDAQDVTGHERLDVLGAALAAASLVIAQEHPSLRCRVVDAESDPSADALGRLADEIASDSDDAVVSLRGRHRWTRGFRAVKPAPPAATLRDGGAYLLVGGMAGQNAIFARALASVPGVRLGMIASADLAADDVSSLGSDVHVFRADLTDAADLERAIEAAEARFGRLDGMLWTPDDAAFSYASAAEARAAWREDLHHLLRQIDALRAALGARKLDFCLAESSLAGTLGGVGLVRAALAHAVADAFALRHARTSRARWTSVAADRWLSPGELAGGIPHDAVPAVLARVLALAGEPQVLVSPGDLDDRLRRAAHAEVRAIEAPRYARPDDLGIDYAPPTNELEERIAGVWQELLGLERIGIHDDFFALGGHSLLATQIVGRLRDIFELELPLAVIFEAPTVAKMAAMVDDAFLAEIEALSDEEAAAMAGEIG
jgi:phthiocerol/phenolphthiocerol synthesis type-I polyketide synthase E